jgi:hypothetical protein
MRCPGQGVWGRRWEVAFQGRVERFREGAVCAGADRAHRLSHAQARAESGGVLRGVDRSVVRVKDSTLQRAAFAPGGFQRIFDKLAAHVLGHRPAGQLAGTQVDHGAENRGTFRQRWANK